MSTARERLAGTPLEPMIEMYEEDLEIDYDNANTRRIYVGAVTTFAEYVMEKHKITDWDEVTTRHIERFRVDVKKGVAPGMKGPGSDGYTSNLYRALQVFFRWWCKLPNNRDKPNPILEAKRPEVKVQPVDVLREDQLTELLRRTEPVRGDVKTDFVQYRDRAILLLFIDTGLRRAELTGLTVADVDIKNRVITVRAEIAKNGNMRHVSFGDDAARALRYYRDLARNAHPQHDLEELWLGERGKGPLTPNGVYQMVRKRGKAIGVDPLYPHMLRHTWVHSMKKANMQSDELRKAAGWQSDAMLARYAASTAAERALETMRAASPGDRLRKGRRK